MGNGLDAVMLANSVSIVLLEHLTSHMFATLCDLCLVCVSFWCWWIASLVLNGYITIIKYCPADISETHTHIHTFTERGHAVRRKEKKEEDRIIITITMPLIQNPTEAI